MVNEMMSIICDHIHDLVLVDNPSELGKKIDVAIGSQSCFLDDLNNINELVAIMDLLGENGRIDRGQTIARDDLRNLFAAL